jgi:hypothetical protein
VTNVLKENPHSVAMHPMDLSMKMHPIVGACQILNANGPNVQVILTTKSVDMMAVKFAFYMIESSVLIVKRNKVVQIGFPMLKYCIAQIQPLKHVLVNIVIHLSKENIRIVLKNVLKENANIFVVHVGQKRELSVNSFAEDVAQNNFIYDISLKCTET